MALIAAAMFVTTSCQNKGQEQAQDSGPEWSKNKARGLGSEGLVLNSNPVPSELHVSEPHWPPPPGHVA